MKSRGIGTQVVHGHLTQNVARTSLFDDLSGTGKRPGSRVLIHEVVAAPHPVAEAYGVEVGAAIFHLRRVRLADDVPFAILENYLPESFAKLTPEQFEQNSLYRLMRPYDASMRVAKQNIGARKALAEEGDLLEICAGAPVLSANRTVYDNFGKAVDFGRHCYRPDLYSFDITLVDK